MDCLTLVNVCLYECERWWSACRSTGTGPRAGVLLHPAAVPGHTATMCQRCPLFNTPTSASPSVFPYVSIALATFPSNLPISRFTSHLSAVLFLPFASRFCSPLFPLLPKEVNPTVPFICFSICISCLCPSLTRCPGDILRLLFYSQIYCYMIYY